MNGDESWPGYDNLVYVYRSNVEFIFNVMNVYVVNLVYFIYTTWCSDKLDIVNHVIVKFVGLIGEESVADWMPFMWFFVPDILLP